MLDLKRAFDMVDRDILIKKMIKRNLPHHLTALVAHLLSDTKHYLPNENATYNTTIGVP